MFKRHKSRVPADLNQLILDSTADMTVSPDWASFMRIVDAVDQARKDKEL